jgi:hypothetical protein
MAVIGCLVASDVAAGGAGRGDGDAGLDGDLVGVGFTVISAVLRACASPTWIFCPPTMIAPRPETRRVTVSGSGRRGD